MIRRGQPSESPSQPAAVEIAEYLWAWVASSSPGRFMQLCVPVLCNPGTHSCINRKTSLVLLHFLSSDISCDNNGMLCYFFVRSQSNIGCPFLRSKVFHFSTRNSEIEGGCQLRFWKCLPWKYAIMLCETHKRGYARFSESTTPISPTDVSLSLLLHLAISLPFCKGHYVILPFRRNPTYLQLNPAFLSCHQCFWDCLGKLHASWSQMKRQLCNWRQSLRQETQRLAAALIPTLALVSFHSYLGSLK